MASDDRRFSSYAHEIDAAIERVVAHFEDNDVALRLDVLRGLATHAKLAFESERVKQRLTQHPVAKDLIDRVATASTVFARLHRALVVEQFSCEYDRHRNVEMRATVRWTLGDDNVKPKNKMLKTSKRRARVDAPLLMQYTFTRATDEDKGETMVAYAVAAGVGIDAELKPLVRYELASDAAYPRSFYEEDHDIDSDKEEDEVNEGSDKEEEEEDGKKQDDDAKDEYGEQVRAFDFQDTVMDAILAWLHADDEALEPADAISFFLSLPMYEDDWMIDERVCQILFSSGLGDDSDMDEEIVSDFEEDEQKGSGDGGDLGE